MNSSEIRVFNYSVHAILCLGNTVVSMMDSHSSDRGSSLGQGKHIIRYAQDNIQLISDESFAELVLYLCE